MEEEQILEIWDTFRDFISEKDKESAAEHYVQFLLDQDFDEEFLENLKGHDSFLDDAIKMVSQLEEEDEDDIDEDLDYEDDEEY